MIKYLNLCENSIAFSNWRYFIKKLNSGQYIELLDCSFYTVICFMEEMRNEHQLSTLASFRLSERAQSKFDLSSKETKTGFNGSLH